MSPVETAHRRDAARPHVAASSRTRPCRSSCCSTSTGSCSPPRRTSMSTASSSRSARSGLPDRPRRPDRLGPGRGARVRVAAEDGVPLRLTGQDTAARDLQPAPPGAGRRRDRRALRADPAPEGRQGAVRAAQQPALGGRRARLRVRLQRGGARGARDVGGPVRRLRQRRPGDHRPVPRRRPRQVGRDVARSRCCCRTATRAPAPSTRARASSAS